MLLGVGDERSPHFEEARPVVVHGPVPVTADEGVDVPQSEQRRGVNHLPKMFDRRALNLSNRLYDEALTCRMRPFADGIQAFPRLVRDVARSRTWRDRLSHVLRGPGWSYARRADAAIA